MIKNNLKEYRCPCGKLLFKGSLFKGTVEIKCKHCREIASFLGNLNKKFKESVEVVA